MKWQHSQASITLNLKFRLQNCWYKAHPGCPTSDSNSHHLVLRDRVIAKHAAYIEYPNDARATVDTQDLPYA